jgi:hypothetical protein
MYLQLYEIFIYLQVYICFLFLFFFSLNLSLPLMGYIQNVLKDQVFKRSVNIIKMEMLWHVKSFCISL